MSIQKIAAGGMRAQIAPLNKGIGWLEHTTSSEDAVQCAWNLLREEISLPAAVLYEEKLLHNLDWMRRYVDAYGVRLAPHGKTTMAPRLFAMQIEAGAWGITLATAPQVRTAYEHGVRRVLMANQLVGRENMRIVAHLLRDPEFEFHCLVDSADQVDQLGSYFAQADRTLNVLLEVGVPGGRSGVRNAEQLEAVLERLAYWRRTLLLTGVEVYEGVLKEEAQIRDLLQRVVAIANQILVQNSFQRSPFILTGAGTAWYDVVADVFCNAQFGSSAEIVLRPGCYLTHDVGAYRASQARIEQSDGVAARLGPGPIPALHIWAYVLSIPEEERAIIGMGKRDAAFDSGLPVPAFHHRPGSAEPRPAPAFWTLTKMMDQHAYMQISPGDDLRVGDLIAFDIAHPCLTFDKWRVLPIINDRFDVVDLVETYF